MKRYFALIIVCLIIVLSACSKKVTNNIQGLNFYPAVSSASIGKETIQEIDEERASEIAFSWFKENHYFFQPNKEDKYHFRVEDFHEDIYGEDSYVINVFFEGKHEMFFAVTVQTGKLYLNYNELNFYVPVDNIKYLGPITKEDSETRPLSKKLEKDLNEAGLVYYNTIQREDETYFEYAKLKSIYLKSLYLVNVITEETFKWELDKDTFEKTELTSLKKQTGTE